MFGFTEDMKEKQELVRKFCEDWIYPNLAEIDAGKWEITAFVWSPLFNGNTEGTYVGTATIAPKSGETTEATGVDKLTITLTVVVEEQQGVEYVLGDVNGDGRVNGSDITALKNHVSDLIPISDMSDVAGRTFKASDVNGDGRVNGSDITKLKNHVSDLISDENIGKTFVN